MVPGKPPNIPGSTIIEAFSDMDVYETKAIARCPTTSMVTSGPMRIYVE